MSGAGNVGSGCQPLSDDIGQQLIFEQRYLIFQDQFSFFKALDMQLVERWFFRDARDCLIEILMLGFERLDLASYFFVTIHFLDHSSIGRR